MNKKEYFIVRCSGQSHGSFTDEKSGKIKGYAYNHLFCEKVLENEKGIELSRSATVEKLAPDTLLTDVIFDSPVVLHYDKYGRVSLCLMLTD